MNKHGQSLVTFILFLPLIVLFLGFIVDVTISSLRKSHLDGIITSNMEVILNKELRDSNEIRNILLENDKDIEVSVGVIEDSLNIYLKDHRKSLYGKIVNQLDYHYCANYVDKKINKKCG